MVITIGEVIDGWMRRCWHDVRSLGNLGCRLAVVAPHNSFGSDENEALLIIRSTDSCWDSFSRALSIIWSTMGPAGKNVVSHPLRTAPLCPCLQLARELCTHPDPASIQTADGDPQWDGTRTFLAFLWDQVHSD